VTREIASFRFGTKHFTFIALVSAVSSRESCHRHGTTNLPREQSNKFAIVQASSCFSFSSPLSSFSFSDMRDIALIAAACPRKIAEPPASP